MPTLNWIGKDKVINHHLDVPYRVLNKEYTFNAEDSENKIIHGDNLEALKALLPEYEGKIKCIYIDPPYNTGNEGWVYNDNVNDPKIKKWLGEVVGKESEDLTRHDKWLCMMYPRLKLLHKLLAKDGVIFISIDNNEVFHLKLICDEIFGKSNFIDDVIWRSSDNSNNDSKQFSIDYNHTIIYSKENGWLANKLNRNSQQSSHYKNPDNDPRGPYFDGNPISSPNYRENLCYEILAPNGNIILPPKNGWRWSKETLKDKLSSNEIRFNSTNTNIIRRTYLNEQKGLPPSNLWIDLDKTQHNRRAKYDLVNIFNVTNSKEVFQTPKPSKFIKKILEIATNKDSIILDSFAGSGTTAHAVLNLNKEDGGNRKFILVEMEEYAENITAERVKRVINGYGEEKKKVDGTGGDFNYYELGLSIFKEEFLNEELSIEEIRKYIWYSETKEKYVQQDFENPYLVGINNKASYYFLYEKDKLTTLNMDFLNSITIKSSTYVIYADNCVLPKEFLTKNRRFQVANATFK